MAQASEDLLGGSAAAVRPPVDEKAVRAAVDRYVKTDAFGGEVDEPRAEALEVVLEGLRSKKIQLLDLVLHLDGALNDTGNPQGRREATRLLANCLEDPEVERGLNFKHVLTFVHFFSSKLVDWQCVQGAVGGLAALLEQQAPQLRTLTEDDGTPVIIALARTLFKSVHTPSHTQAVRKSVLEFAQALLKDWKADMETIGSDLGDGIVGVIEEERDPRNLLVAFSLARTLLEDYGDSCISNESLTVLFESLTSYFPITFTPPKDDKYGITGDDLREALNAALAATPRLAEFVVPFLLDSTKDITVGDNDTTITDALTAVSVSLARYGPAVARKHLGDVLRTARDQVCRTTTPCQQQFADMLESALRTALGDVRVGLTPQWLSRAVDPFLRALAVDAAKGQESLASNGSKVLLVAAAKSHPAMLQQVWALASPFLDPCPRRELRFLLALVQAGSEDGKVLLNTRQLKKALAAAAAALLALEPDAAEAGTARPLSELSSGEEELSGFAALAAAVQLTGLLCRLVGDAASAEGFELIRLLLGPVAGAAEQRREWGERWRRALAEQAEAPGDAAVVKVLLGEAAGVVQRQPGRAAELSPVLLAGGGPAWLVAALPRLLLTAASSLAARASEPPPPPPPADEKPKPAPEPAPAAAGELAEWLLEALAGLVRESGAGGNAAVATLAEALEVSQESNSEATAWVASRLAGRLGLPRDTAGLRRSAEGGGSPAAARRLAGALLAALPPAEAAELRKGALAAATSAGGAASAALALVPAVLLGRGAPRTDEIVPMDWNFAPTLLKVVCKAAAGEISGSAAERLALDALEALLVACPKDGAAKLLKTIEESFQPVLKASASGPAPSAQAARGAARCWAAAAAALLRRGGFATEAGDFLKDLLSALEKEASPVAPFVPVAFQVMMPPSFDEVSSAPAAGKLPSLALQQLSLTVLPQLMASAKAAASCAKDVSEANAALECAVTLLCALPSEVLQRDCTEALRWCVLTGLKSLRPDFKNAVFLAQVLQLLVRAANRASPWIEDDLQSVIPALAGACCASHPVPLVRLGCLQALRLVILQAQGHALPYRRQIEAATRKAVEDRRREVRLVAVACLNAWQCSLTAERD